MVYHTVMGFKTKHRVQNQSLAAKGEQKLLVYPRPWVWVWSLKPPPNPAWPKIPVSQRGIMRETWSAAVPGRGCEWTFPFLAQVWAFISILFVQCLQCPRAVLPSLQLCSCAGAAWGCMGLHGAAWGCLQHWHWAAQPLLSSLCKWFTKIWVLV